MMKGFRFLIFTLLAVALLWPGTAYARGLLDDRVIFGGSFTLESGESLQGDLVIFGGTAVLKPGSIVHGDAVLMGGAMEVNGVVDGNLVGVAGVLRLNETATVKGDLVTIGATLQREEGAVVRGQVVEDVAAFLQGADDIQNGERLTQMPVSLDTNPLLEVIWFFFRLFMYVALAVLVVVFFPSQTGRVADAALSEPVVTFGAGLLTVLLVPLALVVLILTILLIPVALVTILLFVLAWMFGMLALGYAVGQRIAEALNQQWAPAVSAGLGVLALFFVLGGFSEIVPCIGWVPEALAGIWGLGAVLMTYFGTQSYGEGQPENPWQTVIPGVGRDVEADSLRGDSTPEAGEEPLPEDGFSPGDVPSEEER